MLVLAACHARAMRARRDEVYTAYWRLAAERQRVFLLRAAGQPPPWTADPIISRFKFTNAYRASDRVTQFLVRDVIYQPTRSSAALSSDDQLARIILFRLFSKPETWQAIEADLGCLDLAQMRGARLPKLLETMQSRGPIYTSAFILCANKAYGHQRKFNNHLALIGDMFRAGRLPRKIAAATSLGQVYEALLAYPLLGPFMAYQIAIDINYSELIDFSEDEFTMPGPGAERGIEKVFPGTRPSEMAAVIYSMVEAQHSEPHRLAIDLPTLFGRPLHAIDCQNLFCELDKYARVAFPELKSARQRIKSTFRPNLAPIPLFYPPKWDLNDLVSTPVVVGGQAPNQQDLDPAQLDPAQLDPVAA